MQVTERMRVLGDHAKSSRQPPLRERKRAKADESAAKPDPVDESILETGATHDSEVAALVDDVTPQVVVHENGNGGAVAGITSDEGAKRNIIHEWENWSALHSDELEDPNVSEYFFRHLQQKKPVLLNFSSQDKQALVRRCLK